jgi:hypothetical protein
MEPLDILLGPDEDRVVQLTVTDKHGEIYQVSLEFLNHEFDLDEVNVGVHKLPEGWKELIKKEGSCPALMPNRIIHDETTIDKRKKDEFGNEWGPNCHVWFEFHEIDGFKAIKSNKQKVKSE